LGFSNIVRLDSQTFYCTISTYLCVEIKNIGNVRVISTFTTIITMQH
jgi:hypothetical protein